MSSCHYFCANVVQDTNHFAGIHFLIRWKGRPSHSNLSYSFTWTFIIFLFNSKSHLRECFNSSLTTGIPVRRRLSRYKHWFQYNNPKAYPHDTLVLAQFRNPYDWLKAMEHVPHHSPEHISKHWSVFLSKPWTMDRIGSDLLLTGNETCQENFHYRDIISCAVKPLPETCL